MTSQTTIDHNQAPNWPAEPYQQPRTKTRLSDGRCRKQPDATARSGSRAAQINGPNSGNGPLLRCRHQPLKPYRRTASYRTPADGRPKSRYHTCWPTPA